MPEILKLMLQMENYYIILCRTDEWTPKDGETKARDYKEISSMSRCSTHDSVLQFNPKIENSEVVTINKL